MTAAGAASGVVVAVAGNSRNRAWVRSVVVPAGNTRSWAAVPELAGTVAVASSSTSKVPLPSRSIKPANVAGSAVSLVAVTDTVVGPPDPATMGPLTPS